MPDRCACHFIPDEACEEVLVKLADSKSLLFSLSTSSVADENDDKVCGMLEFPTASCQQSLWTTDTMSMRMCMFLSAKLSGVAVRQSCVN